MDQEEYFSESGIIQVFPGYAPWHYILVPSIYHEMGRVRIPKGFIPIEAVIGSITWQTSILPHGDGKYFIAIKKKVREAEKLLAGQKIEIKFKLI